MTIRLEGADIRKLVPRYITDDAQGYAIECAIQAGIDLFLNDLDRAYISLTDVSEMPEWALDEMATAYGLKWYDLGATVDVKRNTVAGRIRTSRLIGTPSALTDAVKQYFGDGRVVDRGNFHFTVETSNESATGDNARALEKIVRVLKNVRSVYDGATSTNTAGVSEKALFELHGNARLKFEG